MIPAAGFSQVLTAGSSRADRSAGRLGAGIDVSAGTFRAGVSAGHLGAGIDVSAGHLGAITPLFRTSDAPAER